MKTKELLLYIYFFMGYVNLQFGHKIAANIRLLIVYEVAGICLSICMEERGEGGGEGTEGGGGKRRLLVVMKTSTGYEHLKNLSRSFWTLR